MIPGGQCSIPGCGKRATSRGWCQMHYTRARRHGDPLRTLKAQEPGPADGVCTIEDCARPAVSRGWCSTHYCRWLRHGDPTTRLNGEASSYAAVHARLRVQRGPACNHRCSCGEQAAHWAYDHQDADELTDHDHRGRTLVYSADLDHYQPMCAGCHIRLDRRHAQRRRAMA